MKYKEFTNHFEIKRHNSNTSCMAICPAHNDKQASLSISEGGDKILINCFAGCHTSDILNAVGLEEKDLFNNGQEKSKVVAEYIYKDENSNPLYKVIRFEPKNFVQARYHNGNWIFKMAGVKYVLYNLPNVIKSDVVYFVEGEKDADNLNKLGLVATTTVSGVASFNKHREEYVKNLKGKTIYVIPDNDEAGHKYAVSIMNSLKAIAQSAKILDLSKEVHNLLPKQDISDVILKYGKEKTLEIINKLKENTDFSMYSGQHLNIKMLKNILNDLNITIRYNEITKETEVKGMPKEYSEDSAVELLPAFISELCIEYGIKYKERDIKNIFKRGNMKRL